MATELMENFYTKDLLVKDNFIIGDYTYGKPNVYDWNEGSRLIIGRYTSIADEVTILLGGNHHTDWISTYPFPALSEYWPEGSSIQGHPWTKGDIVIGHDVWVGNGATIVSGVTVGDGAVIAARSVVTKDIPPYAIVGGNPAKIIKMRFPEEVVDTLREIQWWDWPELAIREHIPVLCSGDIDRIASVNEDVWKKYDKHEFLPPTEVKHELDKEALISEYRKAIEDLSHHADEQALIIKHLKNEVEQVESRNSGFFFTIARNLQSLGGSKRK